MKFCYLSFVLTFFTSTNLYVALATFNINYLLSHIYGTLNITRYSLLHNLLSNTKALVTYTITITSTEINSIDMSTFILLLDNLLSNIIFSRSTAVIIELSKIMYLFNANNVSYQHNECLSNKKLIKFHSL